MKKAFIVTLALFLAFSMATIAAAEDRLELAGEFRTAGISRDNDDFTDATEDQFDYWYMRVRLEQRINVMDGVAVRLRTDWQETTWGLDTGLFGRPDDANAVNSELHIDRAFIQIEKPKFRFLVGHMADYWGHASAYGIQEMGMGLIIKTPVEVTFNYFKLTENGSVIDEDATEDRDLYGVKLQYNKFGGYFAMVDDSTPADDSPWVVGLYGTHAFGGLQAKAALDVFGGDSAVTDYMGTQFALNLEYAFSKAFNAGANFYYAQGTNDPNEFQLDVIHNRFGGFEWHEKALLLITDLVDPLPSNQPFDLGTNTGSVSGDVYLYYYPIPEVTIAAQVGYFTPEEDDVTNIDSLWMLNGSVRYAFAKGAFLQLSGYYTDQDLDAGDADAKTGLVSYLQVNF